MVEAGTITRPVGELVLDETERPGGAGGADDAGVGCFEELLEVVPVLRGDQVAAVREVPIDDGLQGGGQPWVGAFEIEERLDVFGQAADDFGEPQFAALPERERPAIPADGDGAEGLVVADFDVATMEPDIDFDHVGAGVGGFVDQVEPVAVAVGDEQGALVWGHAGLPHVSWR